MNSVINLIGTVAVAIIGLIGIKMQIRSKEKQDNIDTKLSKIDNKFTKITDDIHNTVEEFKKESARSDQEIGARLDKFKMVMMKITLVNEMTKIKDGVYHPNEEQKAILKETKNEYNKCGGNSYVNDMYDDLRKNSLL